MAGLGFAFAGSGWGGSCWGGSCGLRLIAADRLDHKINDFSPRGQVLDHSGDSPVDCSKVLGHSSEAFTYRVYGHLLPGMQEMALDRFDGGGK